jgi:hypothetical protein
MRLSGPKYKGNSVDSHEGRTIHLSGHLHVG